MFDRLKRLWRVTSRTLLCALREGRRPHRRDSGGRPSPDQSRARQRSLAPRWEASLAPGARRAKALRPLALSCVAERQAPLPCCYGDNQVPGGTTARRSPRRIPSCTLNRTNLYEFSLPCAQKRAIFYWQTPGDVPVGPMTSVLRPPTSKPAAEALRFERDFPRALN